MYKNHVFDLGVGTLIVLFFSFIILGGCLIGAAYVVSGTEVNRVVVPAIDRIGPLRPSGELGQLSEKIISESISPDSKEAEVAYGPLNPSALHEVKHGPLLDLIRSRRSSGGDVCSSRSVVRVQRRSAPSYQAGYRYVVRQSQRIVSPRNGSGDCVPCQPATPVRPPQPSPDNQPIDIRPASPSLPLPDTNRSTPSCPDGRCPIRAEVSVADLVPISPVLLMLPDLM